jgi:hypothetical protein
LWNMALRLHISTLGTQVVCRVRRSTPLLFAVCLFASEVHSQYSRQVVTLKARTVNKCDSTVLLLVDDAPLADGWLMTDAKVENDRLVGTLQRAHPLGVAQLEDIGSKKRNTRSLYDLPERFLLVHVPGPVLADLVPGQSFTLSLSTAKDIRYFHQTADGRTH